MKAAVGKQICENCGCNICVQIWVFPSYPVALALTRHTKLPVPGDRVLFKNEEDIYTQTDFD